MHVALLWALHTGGCDSRKFGGTHRVTNATRNVTLFTVLPSRMARGGRGSFGLTSSRRGRGSFRGYRGNTSFRGGRGRGRGGSQGDSAPKRADDGTQLEERFEQVRLNDEVDEKLGFGRIQEGGRKEAWLVNMHPVCGNGSFDHAPYSITDA